MTYYLSAEEAGMGRGVPDVAGRDLTDHVVAGERWTFDSDVAEVFDDMLARSIPGYDEMRYVTTLLGERFVGDPGRVVDLGASRGEAVARVLEAGHELATVAAVEVSPPMAEAARDRLGDFPNAEVSELDLRTDYPGLSAVDLVLCVLTLQFVPIEHRWRLLGSAYASLRTGGALILIEKVLGGAPWSDALLSEAYYERKRVLGYSEEEIDRKRLALEGVLVPVTAELNETMLEAAGFDVEPIWRCMNFAGWLGVKA